MDVKTLWNSGSVSDWYERLLLYYHMPSVVDNYSLEIQLEMLKPEDVEAMTAEQFYDFLYSKYYVWKFTEGQRRKRCINLLKAGGTKDLVRIKNDLFELFNKAPDGTKALMKTVTQIHGLGPAGGSGLLAILFPEHYGTIDQFVVKSLQKVGLPEAQRMDPEYLTIEDAVVLEDIYRSKARKLNSFSGGNNWTPRRIDMVLWTYGRNKCREEI